MSAAQTATSMKTAVYPKCLGEFMAHSFRPRVPSVAACRGVLP